MSTITTEGASSLRRSIYALMIVAAMGMVVGRILSVDDVGLRGTASTTLRTDLANKRAELEASGLHGEALKQALDTAKNRMAVEQGLARPFLSANDRSRWCTVRALVEPAMRVEGAPFSIDKVILEPGWDTIDMVRSKKDDHLYSSKPPILPVAMAAEYWIIYHTTGLTLGENPYTVGRIILLTFNAGSLLLYFLALARLIERFGATDWGRMLAMAAGVFGTFLTTFAVTINNHLLAAVFAALLLEALVRIWFDGDRHWWTFVVAGLSSGLLTANELPAAAFSAAATAVLLAACWRQTLKAYLPAALLVVVAFFATNLLAVHSWVPAYLHRTKDAQTNWYDYSYPRVDRHRNVRVIDSYWRKPVGIDIRETSTLRYTFHALLGHHGIFSLTPIYFASLAGGLMWLVRPKDARLRWLTVWIGLISIVCLAFYIWWPTADRNYGGVTSGFRWVFWLAPLWMILVLPVADYAERRPLLRWLLLAALGISAMSAAYPTWNPWTHPWLYDWMAANHWL